MSPATADPPLIPDGIQPIVAYRAWRYGGTTQRHRLQSVAHGDRAWTKGWNVASCPLGWPAHRPLAAESHRAPAEGCSCGLYALMEPPDILAFIAHPGVRMIIGKVELAGKVIEHDAGYRAERARVIELLPLRGQERDAKAVATIYGARVSKELRHVRPLAQSLILPASPWGRIRRLARLVDQSRLSVVYLLLLSQILGLISKDIRGRGLVAGIGVVVGVGVAITYWVVHILPLGGRAARPTNPRGRVRPVAQPFGTWRDRRPSGVFMLPRGD